jgi:NADH kinase
LTKKFLRRHITSEYPSISLIAEPTVAAILETQCPHAVCAPADTSSITNVYQDLPLVHSKTDLVATFGGDGTILRASSLFSTTPRVPPILSFAMGTLGFLGEWKIKDYKRAFREVYMSGAPTQRPSSPAFANQETFEAQTQGTGWDKMRGKLLGDTRASRILLRHRLRVGMKIPTASGSYLPDDDIHHAMNEVLIHRGMNPHLIHILIHVNGRFLTEAVADGMLVSTPTGSTAYSLSSGGSIIHPLVPSLLLTPICPRSLSFRPLVLPATSQVTLTLSEKNRSKEAEFSVDGLRRPEGVGIGYEISVTGEQIKNKIRSDAHGSQAIQHWTGGVPCIMRAGIEDGDDGWVGGLTNLLKFNYPFGEED